MQRWVPLAVSAVLVLAAGGWFGYEVACGDTTRDAAIPGQPAPDPQCARGNMLLPTFALGVTISFLGGGIAAYRKPPSRTDIDPTILRFAYWPLLASFTFFTTINLGGYGVYVFPLAAIAILVALWARDAGPWALAAGGALSALTALLQWWRELEAIRQPTNAPEEHLIMPWWSLTVLLVCGIAAAAGAPFWPNWWSYVIFAPSLIGWAALFLPETPPETLFFALPGMLLVTAGFARCVVGTYQRGPVKEEKDEPMYPELERSESRRVS